MLRHEQQPFRAHIGCDGDRPRVAVRGGTAQRAALLWERAAGAPRLLRLLDEAVVVDVRRIALRETKPQCLRSSLRDHRTHFHFIQSSIQQQILWHSRGGGAHERDDGRQVEQCSQPRTMATSYPSSAAIS